ncbi:MAG TPA: cytochrome c [Gemmatimonadaceae bacterium]|nr:cytochrome c [Gemmatimonadaceae bacterium]
MLRPLAVAATIVCVAAAVHRTVDSARSNRARVQVEPGHTVLDSVYTDSQATAAESTYKQGCAKCHGAALEGAQDGGPLTGPIFMTNWQGLTLADLQDKIRTTMPPDTPNTIPPSAVADLVGLVLERNQFPAGTKPLTADPERLKDIKIVPSKP